MEPANSRVSYLAINGQVSSSEIRNFAVRSQARQSKAVMMVRAGRREYQQEYYYVGHAETACIIQLKLDLNFPTSSPSHSLDVPDRDRLISIKSKLMRSRFKISFKVTPTASVPDVIAALLRMAMRAVPDALHRQRCQ